MIARYRRWIGYVIPLVAATVMIVGLWPQPAMIDDASRTQALASNLKCPFCNGEAIADSPSSVARDLEAIIAEQVAAGMSDEEIYGYFAARYGERVLLDPPADGWGVLLWAGPAALLVVGVAAIIGLRRNRTGVVTAERGVSPAPREQT